MLIGLIILLVVVVVDKLLQQVLVEMTCGTTAAEKAGVVFTDEAERSSTLAEKHEEGNVSVIALFCRSVPFLIRSARMRESGDVVVCLCVKSMWDCFVSLAQLSFSRSHRLTHPQQQQLNYE